MLMRRFVRAPKEDLVNDLLKLAVDAHGGMQRWEQIYRFRESVSIAIDVTSVTFS